MNRRDAIRLLATAATLPLVPGSMMAAMREARAVVGKAATPRTLNPHQNATVTTMAEMILPRTDTPGATDVGAAEFIDLILTEWYDDPERARFLKGLADVDTHSRALFGKDFADSLPAQQAEILTVLGEKMAEDADRVRDQARGYRGTQPEPEDNFYYMFRRLTLTAYYTSEAGATEELHFEMIPGKFEGCVDSTKAQEKQ